MQAAFIFAEPLHAANLDRPLNDKPTVRTEIVRGINTAFNCGSEFVSDVIQQQHCMIKAVQRDQETHPDYEPFQLGVFFGGCLQFDAEVNAAKSLEKTNRAAARNLPIFRKARKAMFDALKSVQNELRISDTEMVEAGGDRGADASKTLAKLRSLEITHGNGD
ncbi:MAG TPA: hypothetical protein VG387_10410 [Rhizomicrobium sp.]|jgi:hypothetical protein|nr:hypothetical protein [Rhizomicrobium sp.]